MPILFGLASPRTRPGEALAAIGAGIPVWLLARFFRADLPPGPLGDPDLLGLLASLAGFLIARGLLR